MGRLIDEDDVKNWLQKRADGYGCLLQAQKGYGSIEKFETV